MLSHWVLLGVQGLPELLPEQVWVCVCAGPAQVGFSLQEPPHTVVRRQLLHGNVLQEHQDQHVLLLVKQTEAGEWKQGELFFPVCELINLQGKVGLGSYPYEDLIVPLGTHPQTNTAPTIPSIHMVVLVHTCLPYSSIPSDHLDFNGAECCSREHVSTVELDC